MRFAFALACALSLFGCADRYDAGEPTFAESDLSGSVRIPLTSIAADGSSYELRGATFEISGSAMLTLAEDDRPHGRDTLITPLPAGDYSLFLRPGWEIVAISRDGQVRAEPASLVSSNPLRFQVGELGDERVSLRFKAASGDLAFGAGQAVKLTSAEPAAARLAL